MDTGFKQLGQVKSLLTQALGVAQHHMQNDRSVSEAKTHIKRAINEIDKVSKKKLRKEKMTNDQFETWWGNIQSGTAAAASASMSPEAQQMSLDQLNGMIDDEKKKLEDLEKQARQVPDQLLQD
tara:strand:+ start:712 stop:1083 length:372 start_codon:yes stop_codon:yes gene_type:complete